MDTANGTKMQLATDAVIEELKRAAEHPLRAPVIVRADAMLDIIAYIEQLESDLATAEQDSRQKQARIERLEQTVQALTKTYKSVPYAQWPAEMHFANEVLEKSK